VLFSDSETNSILGQYDEIFVESRVFTLLGVYPYWNYFSIAIKSLTGQRIWKVEILKNSLNEFHRTFKCLSAGMRWLFRKNSIAIYRIVSPVRPLHFNRNPYFF